jgi:HPt (histidine-containing phosphotransfer) domain-containing protein
MNNPLSDNAFVFNPPIDSRYLIELYAGDFVMIGETFADVLSEYNDFVHSVFASYQAKDMSALKGAVHKIKPLFGFVGLLSLQSQCQDFEYACQDRKWADLADDFNLLKNNLIQVRALIETEKERLENFNLRD